MGRVVNSVPNPRRVSARKAIGHYLADSSAIKPIMPLRSHTVEKVLVMAPIAAVVSLHET